MPQPRSSDRPDSTIGMPGMVPPITPPADSSIRARYQIVGALKPRCGSEARSVPPLAERCAAAAQAFEAPASSKLRKGDKGSAGASSVMAKRGRSASNRLA